MHPWLAGVLVGDGTRHYGSNKAYAVWIDQHTRNKAVLDYVQRVLQSIGCKTYRYPVPDNKCRVLTYSKDLYLEFESIMKNPARFFSGLNADEKKNFIAGFFDAEGTATDRIVIYSSDTKLLKAIQKFLSELEIPSYIYRFGKVHGVQIYRKAHVELFLKHVKAVRLVALVKKHSRLPSANALYSR